MYKLALVTSVDNEINVVCQIDCLTRMLFHLYLGCVVDVFPPEDPVVQGHSSVVIDELKNLQPCHLCGLKHCPSLRLVEKGWHGDHGIFD